MLEPIDIDINMNQNLSEEAPRAQQANEEMTKSVDSMLKEVERLNKVIQDMSAALAEQRKLTSDNAGEFDNATNRIEVMQAALDKAEKELAVYQSTCEQMSRAVQEGADITDVLVEAQAALAQTEDALVDNAQELIDNQNEINEATEYAKKKSDAYSASNVAVSESIKMITSALGIENTYLKRALSDVNLIAGAKRAWRNGVVLLNKELGLTISQSKKVLALSLATGIGVIVAAVGLAVYAYQSYNKEQKEANRLLAEQKKIQREAAAAVQESVSKVEILDSILKDSNRTYNERNNALKQLKTIMPDYNAQLTREGELIRDNTGALQKYIDKLLDQELAKRAISKLADAKTAYKEWEDSLSDFTKNDLMNLSDEDIDKRWENKYDRMGAKLQRDTYLKQKKKLDDDIKKFEEESKRYVSTNTNTITDDTKAYWEEQKKQAESLLATMTKAEEGSKKWNSALKQYKQAEKNLATWDFKEKKPTTPKATPEEKASTTLEKKAYDYQKRIDSARVAAIHDGAEKERQAAKAEYSQTKAFIEKELKELADLEKKTGKPAEEQRLGLLTLDIEATRQYEAELARVNAKSKATLNEIFTEVNARFANELEQSKADISRYYDQVIQDAIKAGATLDQIEELRAAKSKDINRAELYDQLRKLDLDEALEIEKANNLASIGLTAVAEQTKFEITKKYLKDRIDLLRKTDDETNNKEADILEARLNGLKSSPKSISGLVNGALFNNIKKGFARITKSEEEAQQKTTALFDSFQQGGAQAVAAINDIKGSFGGLDEGLDKALDAVGNIASGFAQGGIVGGAMAVIGEGIKMFTSAAQVEKEHQKALKELALAKLEMQREYNLLLLKEQLYYKQGSNIFGTNQIQGAVNSIMSYRESIALLKKEMKGEKPDEAMGKLYEQMSKNSNKFVAAEGQKQLDNYKRQLEAYNAGVGALADVDIVTGSKKSGWGFWKKRKDVYSNLLDTYDDVIDKEGKLNTNRIEAILNTHKMSDENRALLESLLKLEEAAKEAEEQLRDYLTQTFGGLGDALTDSIVTAFANGTDAAQIFKGNVTDVLNDIAKQMVFGLYLKDTFDKLEKDINTAYNDLADDKLTEEQLSKKITDILGGFFGGLDGDIEKANKFLEEFWKNAEANGFDRPEGERQGTKGGFANASQDSVNEGVGLLYGVRQMLGDIRQDNREELLVHRTIMGQISILVERSEHWVHLKDLPNVVRELQDLRAQGLRLKV